MPEKETMKRVRESRARGRSAGSQAGEFVREEIHHIREGRHGARSAKQAIAIGLSKARRAGVKMPPPKPGKVSEETRRQIVRDTERGRKRTKAPSPRRARAALGALEKEGRSAGTHGALARQAKAAARNRTAKERAASARKAARTRARSE